MATRRNLTLILGIIVAAIILAQSTFRILDVNRTKTAILISDTEYFSSL